MCYSQNMKVTYVLWILCLCCVDVSMGCMLKIIPHLSKVLHCCFDAAVARLLFLFLCKFLLIHRLSLLLSLVVVVPLWVLCCCSIVAAVFGLSIGSCCLRILYNWNYTAFALPPLKIIWCLLEVNLIGLSWWYHTGWFFLFPISSLFGPPHCFWSLVIVVVLLMIQHRMALLLRCQLHWCIPVCCRVLVHGAIGFFRACCCVFVFSDAGFNTKDQQALLSCGAK